MKELDKVPFIFLISFSLLFSSCSSGKKEKINILPVDSLKDDFIMGVDVSSLISLEEAGALFYDFDGKEKDALSLLKKGGANFVRIRVWNSPFDENGNSYGGGNCDIKNAVKLGKRATESGMGVLIDFHYSDFWADPNKQTAPKAWKDFSLEQKEKALSSFTKTSLETLRNEGVNVLQVQVGNEINNGLCGEIYDEEVCSLLKAGCDAVRSFDSKIKIVIHFTDPTSLGYLEGKASMLEKHKVDYDVLSTSFYPYWHGDTKTLSVILKKVSNIYDKEVMVSEISYPFTDEDGDGYGNVVSSMSSNQEFFYPISVEGQATAVRDTIEAVSSIKKGIGVFYWEPAWIPLNHWESEKEDSQKVLSENQIAWEKYGIGWASSFASEYDKEVRDKFNGGTWDNQAFFDFEGKALESINIFNYVKTGSKGKLKPLHVYNPSVEFARGKKEELPKTIRVLYNDGSEKEEKVDWDKKEEEVVLNNPDFGEYTVKGFLKNGYEVFCRVTVSASNFLINGGFETGDLTGWDVINPIGKGSPKIDKNNQNAKEGLSYFTSWEPDDFEFEISQTVLGLSEGKYTSFASFEGTGIKNPSGIVFFVSLLKKDGSKEDASCDVTIPNIWKKFFKAEIPLIVIDDTVESVKVGAKIKAEFDTSSGANGAWLVMDDVNLLLVE